MHEPGMTVVQTHKNFSKACHSWTGGMPCKRSVTNIITCQEFLEHQDLASWKTIGADWAI